MTLKRLKRSARHWFDRTVSVDLRGETDDLLEGLRIAGRRQFILDIPLERWRHSVPVGSVCTAETTDPLINTMWSYDEGRCEGYEGSPLEFYFQSFQPQSMAEGLGLTDRGTGSAVWKTPPYGALFPWQPISALRKKHTKRQREGRVVNDVPSRLGIVPEGNVSGPLSWRPASHNLGEARFRRLISVFRSIKENGYQFPPQAQPLRAEILVRDGGAVIKPTSGKHRIVAGGANRLPSIPVYLGGKNSTIFRREEAPNWPLVKAGFYDVSEAQAIFDRILVD